MDMTVDQARGDQQAVRVDDDIRALFRRSDFSKTSVLDIEVVLFGDRIFYLARYQSSDIVDED